MPSFQKRLVLSVLQIGLAAGIAQSQTDRWNDLITQTTQLAGQGRFVDALPVAQQALSVSRSTFGQQSLQYGVSLNGVGYLQGMLRSYVDAEANLREADEVIKNAVGADNQQRIQPLSNLTLLYIAEATQTANDPSRAKSFASTAENYAAEALSIAQKSHPGEDPFLIPFFEGIAQTCVLGQKYSEALKYLQSSLRIEQAKLPADHASIIRTESELGWILGQMGNRDAAVEQYSAALGSAEKTLGQQDPQTTALREALNRLRSGPTDPSGGNNLSGLTDMLDQSVQDSGEQFRSLRLSYQETFEGDRIWNATLLPGAKACEIWVYKDRSLGSNYECTLGYYSTGDAAEQDFNAIRQVLSIHFAGWRSREASSSSGDRSFTITSDPRRCHIRLHTSSYRGGYRLQLSVNQDRD